MKYAEIMTKSCGEEEEEGDEEGGEEGEASIAVCFSLILSTITVLPVVDSFSLSARRVLPKVT